jgi:hypothetical protein
MVRTPHRNRFGEREFELTNFEYLLTFNFNPKESLTFRPIKGLNAEDNLAFDIVHAIEFSRTRRTKSRPQSRI